MSCQITKFLFCSYLTLNYYLLLDFKIKFTYLCFCASITFCFLKRSNAISFASMYQIQMFCFLDGSNPISCASVHQIQMFYFLEFQYPVLLCTTFNRSVFSQSLISISCASLCTAVSRLSFNLLLCSLTCITLSRPLSNVLCLLNYTTVSRLSSNYFVLAKLHHSLPTLL